MCGRFTRMYTWAQLHALYMLAFDGTSDLREWDKPQARRSNLQPRYNICPTTEIDAVVEKDGVRRLVSMRWGLIPRWWKKTVKELPATFNARSDSVAEKPMYRDAFKRRRCIIPASGYYEWRKGEDGGREPHYFCRADDEVLSLAGLWDEWTDPATGEIVTSCTIIVTDANEEAATIHNRMPVILEKDQIANWLSGKSGTEVLRPSPAGTLTEHRVSRRVNSSRADENDETLIEPE
jgi:putative SOS response-associated peptidase YedK